MESDVLSQISPKTAPAASRTYTGVQTCTLFRSNLKVSLLYSSLLTILQSTLLTLSLTEYKTCSLKSADFTFDSACETTCQLVQTIVEFLVAKCLEEQEEEQQSFQLLLSTLVVDLEQSLACFSVDNPVFVWVLKAMAMTLVAKAYKFIIDASSEDKEEMALSSKLWLLGVISKIANSLLKFQVNLEQTP